MARQHGLDPSRVLFVQQHPDAIDAGVFHNDVIATADRDLVWFHRDAWLDAEAALDAIKRCFSRGAGGGLREVATETADLPIGDAVASYLFNCQLVRRPDGTRVWVGPEECREHPGVREILERIVETGRGFDELHYVDLRQSMRNGGGPACLRLRVVMTAREQNAIHSGVVFTETRYKALVECVKRDYRDRVAATDLRDPDWADESIRAQSAILDALDLGEAPQLATSG